MYRQYISYMDAKQKYHLVINFTGGQKLPPPWAAVDVPVAVDSEVRKNQRKVTIRDQMYSTNKTRVTTTTQRQKIYEH
jgi:hypothetical protein